MGMKRDEESSFEGTTLGRIGEANGYTRQPPLERLWTRMPKIQRAQAPLLPLCLLSGTDLGLWGPSFKGEKGNISYMCFMLARSEILAKFIVTVSLIYTN